MNHEREIARELRAIARLLVLAVCEADQNYDPEDVRRYAYGGDGIDQMEGDGHGGD